MIEFRDRSKGLPHAVLPADLPRGLPNLLDYIEQRGPVISLMKRGRGATEEFRQDLQFGEKRAHTWLQRITNSARAREAVFTAIDGLTGTNRPPEEQIAMIGLVESMTVGDRMLRFCPASSKGTGDVAVMDRRCACAVSEKGDLAFLSTDLGFCELAVMAQGALLQALVLRGKAIGLDISGSEAIHTLCSLPDCDFDHPTVAAEFTKTTISADGFTIPGFMTVRH
jgi:hypothetical protein